MNVLFNTLGLYLTKVASALMNAISYAVLLPCTTLLFFTPVRGAAHRAGGGRVQAAGQGRFTR